MDGKQFDRLARRWSVSASRRLAVRALGAAALGGLANRFSSEALPGGVTLVAGQVAAAEGCRIKKVTLWINAFIPREVFNADGSLYTSEVPDGPHKGETMLPGPSALNDCFLTDQRSFSDAVAAPSRMHSEITINVKTGKVIDQKHRCSPTHEVDCEDGEVECAATGKVSGPRFSNFRPTGGREFTVFLRALAKNPCFTGSPPIDYEGRFRIELNGKKNKVTVLFKGKVDAFPAFEAYAAVDGGAPKPLFQHLPPPGNTPAKLPGRASVTVSGSAVFEEECICPPDTTLCEGAPSVNPNSPPNCCTEDQTCCKGTSGHRRHLTDCCTEDETCCDGRCCNASQTCRWDCKNGCDRPCGGGICVGPPDGYCRCSGCSLPDAKHVPAPAVRSGSTERR